MPQGRLMGSDLDRTLDRDSLSRNDIYSETKREYRSWVTGGESWFREWVVGPNHMGSIWVFTVSKRASKEGVEGRD
jgi:hypothetical protein